MGRVIAQWPVRAYGTILADPPWPLRGGKTGKAGYSKTMSPDAQYPLMSFRQIYDLRVKDVALPDSHLWLWVPNGFLLEGLMTVSSWGFRYVNNVCWYKDDRTKGLGQYVRNKHELCLFAVRGKPPYARDESGGRLAPDGAFAAPRGRHSAKPPDVHRMAELVSPGPRLELFARTRRKGWDAWGNEL